MSQNVGNIAALRSLFEADDVSKGRSIVQSFAEKWLCGRYLMHGSLVSLPVCGCDCIFVVSHIEKPSEESVIGDLPIYKVCAFSSLFQYTIVFCGL